MVEASQTEVRIVLERASTIEGRVVHIDGSGASNAFVLAWAQEWPAQSAVWDGMAGVDDSVAIARCDEEGVFSLPATQGMEVQLTAGLPGSLMFGPNSLPATTLRVDTAPDTGYNAQATVAHNPAGHARKRLIYLLTFAVYDT